MKNERARGTISCFSMKRTSIILRIAVVFMSMGILHAYAAESKLPKTKPVFNSSGTIDEYTVPDVKTIFIPGKLTEEPELTNILLQQRITGTVTDETGSAMPGVNVQVEGTSIGTITDINGKFSIEKTAESAALVFSFIGYITERVPVAGKTVININLRPDIKALEEVVVVGYGTQKKVNLTGAVDQITMESVQDISVPNISRALQGVIPNLNITINNGRPTTNPSYNIRGVTSIGAGGNALILIDGVEGDPRTINPKDIASVSVLKDAASAAIYGARGVFGVVLITTKKPEKVPQFNYSVTYSANSRTSKRDVITDGYLFSKMYMESYTNLYAGTKTPTTVGDVGIFFGQDIVDEMKYRSEHPGHGRPEVDVDPATGHYLYYGNTDWWNLLYKENIPSIEHSFSTSGGSDLATYSISGRYYSQDGLYKIRSDKYKTYDVRLQGNVQPLKWLNINSSVAYSTYNYVDPFSGVDIWNSMQIRSAATPLGVPYNPDGSLTQCGAVSVGVLESDNYTKNSQGQIILSTGIDASIIKNTLSIKGDFSYRIRDIVANQKYVPVPYSNYPGIITKVGESRLYNNRTTENYSAYNLYGDFTRTFGDHALKILGGTNIEISDSKYLNVNRAGLLIEELEAFNLVSGTNFNITGSGSGWSNVGFFARINYLFKEKYLLEINSRYDGSSKFPKSEQFGFFPSVSIGWRVSEEKFLSSTRNWLDNLKPRVSYGSLGNSQISSYLYIEQIKASKTSRLIQGTLPVVTRNPAVLPDDFTWETSTTFDVGLDIDMFKYRLGVVFDWYQRTTTDMITVGPILPSVFGASSPNGNYADLETKGFELSLKWNDQIKTSKPIGYGIRLTLSDNSSVITKYNNPKGTLVISGDYRTAGYYEGMCIGDLWGLTTLGLFVDEADVANHANQDFIKANLGGAPPGPGDIKFADLNGDGKVDWGGKTIYDHGDLSIIGNQSPRYAYGITLNGDYTDFSFSVFFQGIAKRDWYPVHHQNPFWGPYGFWAAEIPSHFIGTSYTNDNPDPNAYWPKWKGNQAYGDGSTSRQLQTQTGYMQNLAYIRLKDLTLSYSLPKQITERLKVKGVRFYFSGQNIWTYSPVFKITKDIDPEQMDTSVGTVYPMLKSYSLGINLSL